VTQNLSKIKTTPKMIKYIISIASLIFCFDTYAQVNFPNPSPLQTIVQDFGMSKIELSYSRPGVKGRKMIGNVEPFDSVWRTGANAPTTIRFYNTVEIQNHKIDSGTYVIYTIPQKKEWTVIINKGIKSWGSDGYKKEDDICRFQVPIKKLNTLKETLTFEFSNVKPESCELLLSWENWELSIPIKSNIKEKLQQQIEANLKSNSPLYWFAAQFYYEYDNKPEVALEMINKAIAQWEVKGGKPYWQYHYKAKILKTLGRKKEAITAANLSAVQAKEHGNRNNYIKLNEDLIKSLK
jgi:hypothetical protein